MMPLRCSANSTSVYATMPSSGTTSASSEHTRNNRASGTGTCMPACVAAALTAAVTASPSAVCGAACGGSL